MEISDIIRGCCSCSFQAVILVIHVTTKVCIVLKTGGKQSTLQRMPDFLEYGLDLKFSGF